MITEPDLSGRPGQAQRALASTPSPQALVVHESGEVVDVRDGLLVVRLALVSAVPFVLGRLSAIGHLYQRLARTYLAASA